MTVCRAVSQCRPVSFAADNTAPKLTMTRTRTLGDQDDASPEVAENIKDGQRVGDAGHCRRGHDVSRCDLHLSGADAGSFEIDRA